jgi:transposase
MRKALSVTFELLNGGQQSMEDWMWQQRQQGQSFRAIADALSSKVGVPVSHEAVRQWLKVG